MLATLAAKSVPVAKTFVIARTPVNNTLPIPVSRDVEINCIVQRSGDNSIALVQSIPVLYIRLTAVGVTGYHIVHAL